MDTLIINDEERKTDYLVHNKYAGRLLTTTLSVLQSRSIVISKQLRHLV